MNVYTELGRSHSPPTKFSHMEWHEGVEQLSPHIVQITTPQGSGTGFFLYRASDDHELCGIATAAHVIDHAHFWEQPIRLRLPYTGETKLLRAADRAILTDDSQDTAVIIFDSAEFSLPEDPHPLMEEGYMQKVGVQIGWLGFPAIPAADLCFFNGTVSAWLQNYDAYFVDGVAINGVSGGPAFTCIATPKIIGVVSAYMPNRATGETLPGLAIVRDVTHVRDVVKDFQSVDEAKAEETPPLEPPTPPGATGARTA